MDLGEARVTVGKAGVSMGEAMSIFRSTMNE